MKLNNMNGEGMLQRLYWEVWQTLASLRKGEGLSSSLDERPVEVLPLIQLDHRGFLFWAPWAPYEAYPAILLSWEGEVVALHLPLDYTVLADREDSPRVDAVIEGVSLGYWRPDSGGLNFRLEWTTTYPTSVMPELPFYLLFKLLLPFGTFPSVALKSLSLCIGGRSVSIFPTLFPFPHIQSLGDRVIALGLPRLRLMANAPYVQLSLPLWTNIALGGKQVVWPITLKRLLHISEIPQETVAFLSNPAYAQSL